MQIEIVPMKFYGLIETIILIYDEDYVQRQSNITVHICIQFIQYEGNQYPHAICRILYLFWSY